MIPPETAYMLGFTAVFLTFTLGVALFVLYRIHRWITEIP